MKNLFFGLAIVGSFIMLGCDAVTMCDVNDDCINMCRTYDNNSLMYGCDNGTCVCVDEKKMKCTGDPETDSCKEICELYSPGTTAVCENGKCKCAVAGI